MNIALAQMEVFAKQPKRNFETMKTMIMQAKQRNVDCIVFGELVISGYLLADTWFDDSFISECEKYNKKIIELADDIVVVWGNISKELVKNKRHSNGRVGLYNCAFIAQNKQLCNRENGSTMPYVKHLLPSYRIFDDPRYFISGDVFDKETMFSPFVVNIKSKNTYIGLEVCEDLWDDHYDFSPTQLWTKNKIDVLVNISSSPWSKEKESARKRHVLQRAKDFNISTFVYINVVGMQNTGKNVVLFDGGSFISNQHGEVILASNDAFKQELTINESSVEVETKHKLMMSLEKGIQAFDEQIFQKSVKWIVGLSGGIDSSVSIALLVRAIGNDRVIAINMPSQFNKEKTINNAKRTAKALDIEYCEYSIEPLVTATQSTLEINDTEDNGFVLENVQARIRGHILSTLASMRHGVVVNNGNKVETALGYCTLYGDTIGALSPLGDCTKMEVFELARQLNSVFDKEIIPNNLIPTMDENELIFDFMPSAELKENQIDPMKWGYHDYLIEQLSEYPTYQLHKLVNQVKENKFTDEKFKKWLEVYNLTNYNEFIDDLNWIIKQTQLSVFKRIQMPPIILVSRGAFGSDLRENQGLILFDNLDKK